MGVKVKATRLGYYGLARRRPGEVFVLRDGQKPPKWTVAVPESETVTPKAGLTEPDPPAKPDPVLNPEPTPKPEATVKRGPGRPKKATGEANVI